MCGLLGPVMLKLTCDVDSMFPLLQKDGQVVQYAISLVAWNYAVGYAPWRIRSPALRYLSWVRGQIFASRSYKLIQAVRSSRTRI